MEVSTRSISLTNDHVHAAVVNRPLDYPVTGRAIVVNLGPDPAVLAGPPARPLARFSSTILVDAVIQQAEAVLLLWVTEGAEIAGITWQPGWHPLAELLPGFPADVPLHRGPQEDLGTMVFDPAVVLGEPEPAGPRAFTVKANLWFAPAGTDCVIHNQHDFIEVHTQVSGYGRMQKFHRRDPATLYEEQRLSPGATQAVPFCGTRPGGGLDYPWHQYHADSACVWAAIEYHAAAGRPVASDERRP